LPAPYATNASLPSYPLGVFKDPVAPIQSLPAPPASEVFVTTEAKPVIAVATEQLVLGTCEIELVVLAVTKSQLGSLHGT
jgi:hypothetical protein